MSPDETRPAGALEERAAEDPPCRWIASPRFWIGLGLVWATALFRLDANPENPPFRSDRLLLFPRAGAHGASLATLHQRTRAEVLRAFPALDGLQVVHVPPEADIPALVQTYRGSAAVAHAEPDYLVHAVGMPNDPSFADGTQWALHNTGQQGALPDADIDAPEGWDIRSSGSNVVVALIDSGLWITHQDLAGNLWVNPGEIAGNGVDDDGNGYVDDVHGLNATTGTGAINDAAGHGTHLAGVIGAVGNNAKGVAGVAWQVQIMGCRFLGPTGSGSISDAVSCIEYARTMGAQVINASWVTTNATVALELAVAKARDAGIVFVAGAGNDGKDNDRFPYYPPNLPLDNVIAVAASSSQDRLWDRSNFGATNVDLAAPGLNIYSTYFIADNNYVSMAGSSQAAAFVCGAAALVRAAFPTASHREVIDRLLYGSDPVPSLRGKCLTGGRMNLRGALDPAPPPVWPHTPLISVGNRGGPFVPASQSYVLLNRGSTPLEWEASASEPWLSVQPAAGTLGAGEKATVTAALVSPVTAFASGDYTNRLEFVLGNPAERVEVSWNLRIYEPATLRLSAVAPPGSGVQFSLTGHPGASYLGEASASFLGWRSVATNTLPASGDLPVFWTDPATNRRLFLRARVWDSP